MMAWAAGAVLATVLSGAEPSVQEAASNLVVIVNKSNPITSLSVAELRRVFSKQTRMWRHGDSMVPVDWDATSDVREQFSRAVMGRTVRQMSDFWVQQSITQGLAPPSTQRSARAILRFVANVPGAISYVPRSDVDDSVKVIDVDLP
jgi:ABC-type phosphate transport system substrate-binding protein